MSDSYLSPEQVETVRSLVERTHLAAHLADVVIASAYVTGQTPREMLVRLAEGYRIDDEQWRTLVAPELALALSGDRDTPPTDERVAEMQSDWFIREVKRCAAIGMPLGCCGEWPECAHVLAWTESRGEEG